jgi:predicted nucleotidyltransferase
MESTRVLRQIHREKVAKEAAWLLYRQAADDYLSAKQTAARNLQTQILPTNAQIAHALDVLSTQIEGPARNQLLITLRRHALEIMQFLHAFHPRLIGSVWRGTARNGSDVDLEVFCDTSHTVINRLRSKYPILTHTRVKKTATGKTDQFLHIHFPLSSTCNCDISVKRLDQLFVRRICEVYNDVITGLTYTQLQHILDTDPLQRFIPKER